jgi:RNA polymerase sigma factor (TIGR02999 family)
MSDVTRILSALDQGDSAAAEQLLPLVYDQLRTLAAARMAREAPGQTLEATALVHEAYLRLVAGEHPQRWNSRGHFFAAAAEAMRRILVDQARHKHTRRAGGDRQQVAVSLVELEAAGPQIDLLSLNDALQRLEGLDPRAAELVKLRFFAGLTIREAAEVLSISVATAENDWAYARSWLKLQLSDEDSNRIRLPARKNARN